MVYSAPMHDCFAVGHDDQVSVLPIHPSGAAGHHREGLAALRGEAHRGLGGLVRVQRHDQALAMGGGSRE